MSEPVNVTLTINGQTYPLRLQPRRTLLDAIRDECGLTGTHMGCEHGVCGACTVLVDGDPVRACLIFAVQAQGSTIRTVEGLADGETLHPLQRAFMAHHGLQCGFCTPGFLMLACGVLEREPDISDDLLLEVLASNLCRCTGYQGILAAVRRRLPSCARPGAERGFKPATGSRFGRSVPRLEDRPLLTGRGQFVGDIAFPHQLHMRVVRSPYAHAALRTVDITAALAVPGVIAVWTGAEIADLPPIDFRDPAAEGLRPYRQPLLARRWLRYVGEPVAAVFATDPYLAEDAADLVAIDADELTPVLVADAPPGNFAPGQSTEALVLGAGYGEVDAAFASAHAIVALDLMVGRHSGVPIETRGALARYDASRDVLELYGATKVPHRNRDALARMFGRGAAAVVLKEGNTGGGFGIRGELYPEDFLVCLAALRLGRPVKWIEDRREHLMTANHSRQQRHHARVAVDAEGRILGLDDEFFLDQGAYVRTHGARVAELTIGMLPGPYRIPAYRAVCHFRLTNKTPAATYRAPGRFEGTFVRERLLDAVADRLGLDRVAVRRRNLIRATEMPFRRPLNALGTEIVYNSGDYELLLDKALERIGWDRLQAELRQRRAAGELVGAGIGIFVEKGGLGPLDGTRVSIDTSGAVELVTGGSSVGQGIATAMAQICADTLGVDYRRVRVVLGRPTAFNTGSARMPRAPR